MTDAKNMDLHLHLMDRQIEDKDARLVGKIDDLELALDNTGHPYVTAILCGPRALGPRIGGRLGHWFVAIASRLADCEHQHIPRIDFRHVTDITSSIRLAVSRRELETGALESWLDDKLISRIPGSSHASE